MITRRATDQGVTFLDVETPLCTATLCLQGAHLTSWKPEGHEECLFLSPKAVFAPGKAIRGGIPVFSQAGALPAAALDSLVEQVRALDMDEVRAAYAQVDKTDSDATNGYHEA